MTIGMGVRIRMGMARRTRKLDSAESAVGVRCGTEIGWMECACRML